MQDYLQFKSSPTSQFLKRSKRNNVSKKLIYLNFISKNIYLFAVLSSNRYIWKRIDHDIADVERWSSIFQSSIWQIGSLHQWPLMLGSVWGLVHFLSVKKVIPQTTPLYKVCGPDTFDPRIHLIKSLPIPSQSEWWHHLPCHVVCLMNWTTCPCCSSRGTIKLYLIIDRIWLFDPVGVNEIISHLLLRKKIKIIKNAKSGQHFSFLCPKSRQNIYYWGNEMVIIAQSLWVSRKVARVF